MTMMTILTVPNFLTVRSIYKTFMMVIVINHNTTIMMTTMIMTILIMIMIMMTNRAKLLNSEVKLNLKLARLHLKLGHLFRIINIIVIIIIILS